MTHHDSSDAEVFMMSAENEQCPCRRCDCPCTRNDYRGMQEFIDEDGYTVIGSDTESIDSGDRDGDEPIQSLRQPQTPSALTPNDSAQHLRLLLRYRFAAPSESAWMDAIQLHLETERLRRENQPSSMDASFMSTSSSGMYDNEDFMMRRSMSMVPEASSRSPMSSLESSMYLTAPSPSSRGASNLSLPLRSNSVTLFDGIGSLFEQSYHFTSSPLKLSAESEFCLGTPSSSRSRSHPSITFDKPEWTPTEEK